MGDTPVGDNYVGQTVLNPLGLAAVIILGFAMLFVPRRYAVWTMIIMGSLVSPAQRIVLLSLNFDLLRIMVLFATARIVIRGEWSKLAWWTMDTVLVTFAIVGSIVYVLQVGTFEAAKGELGSMYETLGMYFVFRCLVRNVDDICHVALGFAIISVPVAAAFLVERATGRNMFAYFGGVPAITGVREGKLRCQGAYAHPIIAGCYWAAILPIMTALWWRRKSDRLWAVIGVTCGLIVIALCNSSTPLSAVMFAIIGAALFVIRRYMALVRGLVVGVLVALHFMMKAPVWSLVARVTVISGSSGWHRFNLIDKFIWHFGDWWLLGSSNVRQWGIFAGDLTNQFCVEAAHGGLCTLSLFVTLIVLAFSRVGRQWRRDEGNTPKVIMDWALGVSLFVHCISFIGVSYFGQIIMLWYLTLAMIASLGTTPEELPVKRRRPGVLLQNQRQQFRPWIQPTNEFRRPPSAMRPAQS